MQAIVCPPLTRSPCVLDLRLQFALLQMPDCRGVVGGVTVVGHHDDRLAEVLIQLLQHHHDVFGRLRVQVTGGLVGDDQVRVGGDGAGDGDALFLAAGKLPREVRQPVA